MGQRQNKMNEQITGELYEMRLWEGDFAHGSAYDGTPELWIPSLGICANPTAIQSLTEDEHRRRHVIIGTDKEHYDRYSTGIVRVIIREMVISPEMLVELQKAAEADRAVKMAKAEYEKCFENAQKLCENIVKIPDLPILPEYISWVNLENTTVGEPVRKDFNEFEISITRTRACHGDFAREEFCKECEKLLVEKCPTAIKRRFGSMSSYHSNESSTVTFHLKIPDS